MQGNCEDYNWRLYCIFYYCLHYVNWQAQFQLSFFFLYSFSDFSHVFGRFSYVQCDSTEMKNISSGKCFHVWFCIKLWKKVVVALWKHVIGKLWFIFMLNINPILIHKDSNVTVHSMIPVICIALRFSLYSMCYSVWGFFFLSPCFLLCLFFLMVLIKWSVKASNNSDFFQMWIWNITLSMAWKNKIIGSLPWYKKARVKKIYCYWH